MNWDELKGSWNRSEGRNSKWSKLTAYDLKQIVSEREELAVRLRIQFGHTKEEAEQQIEGFTKDIKGKQ